ncbi:putative glycogen debranching enzyme [Rosellinia necatrix]|uniref:Putative glycogen debranching enzyme n=1 Tax=Rosellinia necatrix TaxID=77044 RepID=A0A1W2TW20_ROSNE|nr:putative glycogen debranching enzyme [Rosellinia necatrix]
MLKCGNDCYLPREFDCYNGQIEPRQGTRLSYKPNQGVTSNSCPLNYLHLTDRPYENYFVSDCSSASQVVITSPVAGSGLRPVDPRLLIAWPAGNSGIVTYFLSSDGSNGSLAIALESIPGMNRSISPLVGGVTGIISFNSSALLNLAVIGSVRTIRDYVEGNSLSTKIQDALQIQKPGNGTIQLSRTWLDNVTETFLTFQSRNEERATVQGRNVYFEKGSYLFNAWHSYPEPEQLSTSKTLNPQSQDLIIQNPDETASLSFFSFTSKAVAGGWRFLTYFGRDSLISLLLLQPVLSEGGGGAIEAILSAAIERIDARDGSVCHEEVIGDYATYLNEQQGIPGTDAQCDYKMIDTDFFLPIAMNEYFVKSWRGRDRRDLFLARNASVFRSNSHLTYADLVLTTVEKIMSITEAFEQYPTAASLIRLKEGQTVGQWRDSNTGLGGGRIPYDVNTALVPAALYAIASLAAEGLFPSHPEWYQMANKRAQFWEEEALPFFEVQIPPGKAHDLVKSYIAETNFPGDVDTTEPVSPIRFYGISLEANNYPIVKVMNTDDCFRLYLLNSTNQTQLSEFLLQSADNILRPFPFGLSTSVGLLVANPAYAQGSANIDDFKTSSYHGLVVWSWQLSMMAAGLERQLGRCGDGGDNPDFCFNTTLYRRIVEAYNHLWDIIEKNRGHLSSEVWSWVHRDGDYVYTPLGAIPGPEGQIPTESDIRQLWSLTFLAVKRNLIYTTQIRSITTTLGDT